MRRLFTVFLTALAVDRWRVAGATSLQSPASTLTFGPSSFVAPGVFPTTVYDHYYNDPTATTAQPQPIITDPVTVSTLSVNQPNLFFFLPRIRLT